MADPLTADQVRKLQVSLIGAGLPTGAGELVDLVAALEDLKSGICGVQVEVALTSRQRTFPDGLADFLALRGQGICAQPYCDAPVRHADHVMPVVPVANGGTTSADNGQGLCEACNHAKQAPGWEQQVTGYPRERHQVETVTPTGHRYVATAPPPVGWREPRFVKAGPGRYHLIA